MARVVPAASDVVTGTGTVNINGGIFGGFDMSCDGTNLGTLVIRDIDATGRILYNTKSTVGKSIHAPIDCSGTIYYDMSGSGADVMLFEWRV